MTASNSDQPRKYLSIDSLIQGLRERFEAIPDPRLSIATKNQPVSQVGWGGCEWLIAGCGVAD